MMDDLLTRTFREEDVGARWGGDELVIGLNDTRGGSARSRLAQLLEAVRTLIFTSPEGQQFSVGCSAGLAEYLGDGDGFAADREHSLAAVSH